MTTLKGFLFALSVVACLSLLWKLDDWESFPEAMVENIRRNEYVNRFIETPLSLLHEEVPLSTSSKGYRLHQLKSTDQSTAVAFPLHQPALEGFSPDHFLAFRPEHILAEFKNSERLIYDISVIRLADNFNLINDDLTFAEIEEAMQQVVDIFAQANIYVRVSRDQLMAQINLSRGRSLVYMSYVEGPDLAEIVEARRNQTARYHKTERERYMTWHRKQMLDVFPVQTIEQMVRGSKAALIAPGQTIAKEEMRSDILDWVLGFPSLLTPWDILNSAAVFPVSYLHKPQRAFGSKAHVVVGTQSCDRSVSLPKTVYRGRLATCKGFESSLVKRASSDTAHNFTGPLAALKFDAEMIGRSIAHELGQTLGLSYHDSECTQFDHLEEGFLRLPPELVTTNSSSDCSAPITKEHFRATVLTPREASIARNYLKFRDIQPSPMLPRAVRIGESTLQIGSMSPYLFDRVKPKFAGAGKTALAQSTECLLPQTVVVLSRLETPAVGYVKRLRWLPKRFKSGDFTMEVLVVQVKRRLDEDTEFEVLRRTSVQVSNSGAQHTHIEVDLPDNLLLEPGQFLALSASDDIDIDTKVFAGGDALYADVVGAFSHSNRTIFDPLARIAEVASIYPKVDIAQRFQDAFLGAADPLQPGQKTFTATRVGNQAPRAFWCAELIFNFDIVPLHETK